MSDKISAAVQHMKLNQSMSDNDVINALCEIGYPGDSFTSAAPQDPTFWPIHGLAERYIQSLKLWKQKGLLDDTDFDETWGYSHGSEVPSDTHRVCDWSSVEGLQLPTCSFGTCSGHRSSDILPFDNLFSDQTNQLSNSEFYQLLDPNNEAMPYVYEDLDAWNGCPMMGSLYQTYLFAKAHGEDTGTTTSSQLTSLFGGM